MEQQELKFHGFLPEYKKDFYTYPVELQDWWYLLSGAEQKLLDFILRRTLGWQKTSDSISLSQFTNGVNQDGKGSGVSRAQVPRSLKRLEELGFIRLQKGRYKTTKIHLVLREEPEGKAEPTSEEESPAIALLIEMFRNISGYQVEAFRSNKKQVSAMKRLLNHYDYEQIAEFIKIAESTNAMMYAPTILSPTDLEIKLPALNVYLKKNKPAGPNNIF